MLVSSVGVVTVVQQFRGWSLTPPSQATAQVCEGRAPHGSVHVEAEQPMSQVEARVFCNSSTGTASRHSSKGLHTPGSFEATTHRERSFGPSRSDTACQLGVALTISRVPGGIADILLLLGFQNKAENRLTEVNC